MVEVDGDLANAELSSATKYNVKDSVVLGPILVTIVCDVIAIDWDVCNSGSESFS